MFHLNPAHRHKLTRTSEFPLSWAVPASLFWQHSLQGCPSLVVPEETAGGLLASAGAEGWHARRWQHGSHHHLLHGLLNHSNGLFIIHRGDSCSYFVTTIETELEKAMATPLQYPCLENPMDGGAW